MTAGLQARLSAIFEGAGSRTRACVKAQAPLDLRGPLRSAGQHDLFHLRNNTTGILDGDSYEIDVSTCAGARVQVASPSATKVFAMDGSASSRLRIEARPGSTLIWGPHALILQQGADLSQQTSVVLAGGVVLLSEVIVFGRLAAGESGGYRRFQSEFQVCDQPGEVLYEERYTLIPDAPGLHSALGGMGAMASFYALGIDDTETLTAALASGACSQTFSGCSSLPNQAGVVARMLAPSLSQALAFCEAASATATRCIGTWQPQDAARHSVSSEYERLVGGTGLEPVTSSV